MHSVSTEDIASLQYNLHLRFSHQATNHTKANRNRPIEADTIEITNSAEPTLLAKAKAIEVIVKNMPILKKCLRSCGGI